MDLTKQERALIEFIRSLGFEDVLDATNGIETEANEAFGMAQTEIEEGDTPNANGFSDRAKSLFKLAELLGDSNVDYRFHINPESEKLEASNECILLQ
jgi:hypothetical protein